MSKEAKNLSNIDFNNRKIRLETPKSKQALLELGLIESDLFKLDIKEYLAMNPQLKTESKENQEKRYNHYEEKRKEAIEEAIKKREEIIKSINNSNKEQEKSNSRKYLSNDKRYHTQYKFNNFIARNRSFDVNGKDTHSTLVKKELEKLNMIKKHQIGEIRNLI